MYNARVTKKYMSKILLSIALISSALFISGCGKEDEAPIVVEPPAPKTNSQVETSVRVVSPDELETM